MYDKNKRIEVQNVITNAAMHDKMRYNDSSF